MTKSISYKFKGVTLLKGAVHLGEGQDPESFVTMEVCTEKLIELLKRGPVGSGSRSFSQLSISEKAELFTRARSSHELPLDMPTIMLGKKVPNCFFSAYELDKGAAPGGVSTLDLLFPNNGNLFASCLSGDDVVAMFHALNAPFITIQLPREQLEVAHQLFEMQKCSGLPSYSANEEPQVISMS